MLPGYCDQCHNMIVVAQYIMYIMYICTYSLPLGWARVALDSTRAIALNALADCHPLYHGASEDTVEGIIGHSRRYHVRYPCDWLAFKGR